MHVLSCHAAFGHRVRIEVSAAPIWLLLLDTVALALDSDCVVTSCVGRAPMSNYSNFYNGDRERWARELFEQLREV